MTIEKSKLIPPLKEAAFQLRDYPTLIAVEVTGTVTSVQQEASRIEFPPVAELAFGGATGEKPIVMTFHVSKIHTCQKRGTTAPVTQTGAKGDGVANFTMRTKLATTDLSQASELEMKWKPRPVTRYRTLVRAVKAAKFFSTAKTHNLSAIDEIAIVPCDPPWTLWVLHCSDVLVPAGAVT